MAIIRISRGGDRELLVWSDFKLMHKEWHNVEVFLLRVGGIPVTIADFVPTHMNTAHTSTFRLKRTKQRSSSLTVQPHRQSSEWQTLVNYPIEGSIQVKCHLKSPLFIHGDMRWHRYLLCCIHEDTVSNRLRLIDYSWWVQGPEEMLLKIKGSGDVKVGSRVIRHRQLRLQAVMFARQAD